MNSRKLIYTLMLLLSAVAVQAQQHTSFYPSAYAPGEVVPESYLKAHGTADFFVVHTLNDSLFHFISGKTYKKNCTIPRSNLRYLLVLHKNLEGQTLVGEMIVNKAIAQDVLDIFKGLYKGNYPIERMRLIDYYQAEDEPSMRANNSSAFNFRFISHTKTVSKHGKGMAVDINPLYNPYHKRLASGAEVIEPATGKPYLDRKANYPYKIVKGDLCYRLFIAHGFRWGGAWTHSKDYQHFEK